MSHDLPDRLILNPLKSTDRHVVLDHFLRLGGTGQQCRFGMSVSEDFLANYAARVSSKDCMALGAFLGDDLCGLAELHRHGCASDGDVELALSVVPALQNMGIGTRLSLSAARAAIAMTARTLHTCFSADNFRMRCIAQRLDMRLMQDGRMIMAEARLDACCCRMRGHPTPLH